MPTKFRTPTRCQNGHFRWYFYSVKFGECSGFLWSDKPCDCPTHEFGEGFASCGEDQQFTGLNDRNGVPIYEGDILRHHQYGGDHAVEWHTDSTGFFVGKLSWPLSKMCCPNIEVVSHIYAEELVNAKPTST